MRISDWSSDVCSSDLFQYLENESHQNERRRERSRIRPLPADAPPAPRLRPILDTCPRHATSMMLRLFCCSLLLGLAVAPAPARAASSPFDLAGPRAFRSR